MASPTIISRTPAPNAVSVYLNAYLEVVFSQAIDPTTINSNTVLLYRVSDFVIMDNSASFDVASLKLTVIPNIVFDQNTQYNAVLVGLDQSNACIKNLTGEGLATSSSWYFTTGLLPDDPQGEFGENDEEAIDKSTAESPVSLVLPPKSTTDLTIIGTTPENYAANIGSINSDFETVYYHGPIQIQFNQPVASGSAVSQDWVSFEVQPVDGDPATVAIMPAGTLSNSVGDTLIWSPSVVNGADYTWRTNNEITVTVSEDVVSAAGATLGNQFRFMFTTPYRPYYCTVPRIRSVIGSFIREIPDDTIARNIYFNSLEAYNIANTIYSQYLWGIDSPTFAAKMWVCCKTQYDLLYAKLLDQASSGPGMIKRLGDFTIQESTDIQAGVKGALQKSLDCTNAWLKLILGKYRRAKSKMAIKGVTSPATPPMRGVRTWTLETGRDTLGANKNLTRRIKSPGIYSDWS
jgi:hypothetical protein